MENESRRRAGGGGGMAESGGVFPDAPAAEEGRLSPDSVLRSLGATYLEAAVRLQGCCWFSLASRAITTARHFFLPTLGDCRKGPRAERENLPTTPVRPAPFPFSLILFFLSLGGYHYVAQSGFQPGMLWSTADISPCLTPSSFQLKGPRRPDGGSQNQGGANGVPFPRTTSTC